MRTCPCAYGGASGRPRHTQLTPRAAPINRAPNIRAHLAALNTAAAGSRAQRTDGEPRARLVQQRCGDGRRRGGSGDGGTDAGDDGGGGGVDQCSFACASRAQHMSVCCVRTRATRAAGHKGGRVLAHLAFLAADVAVEDCCSLAAVSPGPPNAEGVGRGFKEAMLASLVRGGVVPLRARVFSHRKSRWPCAPRSVQRALTRPWDASGAPARRLRAHHPTRRTSCRPMPKYHRRRCHLTNVTRPQELRTIKVSLKHQTPVCVCPRRQGERHHHSLLYH